MHFLRIIGYLSWLGVVHSHYYEWLVPKDLHRCCDDTIPNYPECKSIDAAAFINGSLVLFSGHHFIHTKVRYSRFPQILNDQSVKSINQWSFRESPQRAMAAEVEAAAHDGNKFIVKKGDVLYTFPTSAGSGDWLSCSRHNGLECRKGGRGLEAMARFFGNDRVKYFITYNQKPNIETDGTAYEVSVKRGPKEWRTYSLSDDSDTVDAIAVYKVRHGVTPMNAKIKEDSDDSETINYAVYFNTHGYACFFELTGEELERKSFYKIERPAITPGVPMGECQPLNIFFGCPQSWCYSSEVDDMIVTQTRDEIGTNREVIIVYRGHYYWTASVDRGVPINPVSVRNQRLAMTSSGENVKGLWYIDAAEAMSVETRDFVLYFIDDKLLLYKGLFDEPEVHTEGKFEQEKGLGYEKVNFRDSQIYDDINELFPNKKCRMVDTLWYNKFEAVLYLFCGAHFQAYDVSYNRKEGIPIFSSKELDGNNLNKISDYFKGLPPDVDATLMIKNHVYITKGQYYYDFEVQLDEEPYTRGNKEPLRRKLSIGSRKSNSTEESYGLFATQQLCGYSDETMSKISDRFSKLESKSGRDRYGVNQLMHMSRDEQGSDFATRTAVIACLVGIVGVLGLIAVGYMAYGIKAKRDNYLTREISQ